MEWSNRVTKEQEVAPTPVIYDSFTDAWMSGMAYKSKWWEPAYYSCSRGYTDLKYWFKKVYQRWTTGFAHEEAWNFCHWHSTVVVPRLKHLRKQNMGHPADLTDEEWVEIIGHMIWSFENHDVSIDSEYPDDYDHRQEVTQTEMGVKIRMLGDASTIDRSKNVAHHERVQEGLDLFAKYYQNLWD
jgi:hypothetical protein